MDRMPKSDGSTIALQYPAGFRQFICQAAGKYHIDPLWLHAIIWQESKYNPAAHSGAAARGLMQFIPETANAVGSTIGLAELSPGAAVRSEDEYRTRRPLLGVLTGRIQGS